ncbi:MAG: type II/IV secretion system ATPase subunit [Halobacteria archaeon]
MDKIEGIAIQEKKDEVIEEAVDYFKTTSEPQYIDKPELDYVRNNMFDMTFLEDFKVVDGDWISLPFTYAFILYDETIDVYKYHVLEPFMDDYETYMKRDLEAVFRNIMRAEDLPRDADKDEVFNSVMAKVVEQYATVIDPGILYKIYYYLYRDFVGYDKIDPILRDPGIEDVSCNGHEMPLYIYHRDYRDMRTNLVFQKEELDNLTIQLAQISGRHISVSNPMVDTTLPDGSRAQLVLGSDIGIHGSNFTIRKYLDTPLTPVDLIKYNTFSVLEMAFMWFAVENRRSMIFVGPTASGKTTSMNAVSLFLPPDSKVVSIEDIREVTIPHKNWIAEITRESSGAEKRDEINMYELLKAALHQRPEYLLVGEIRTQPEVVRTFFQSIFTGHPGSTTFHAKSAEAAVDRLMSEPLSVSLRMINSLDLVSVQAQVFVGDDRVRRNRNIAEISLNEDENSIDTTDLFEWDPNTDSYNTSLDLWSSSNVLQEIGEEKGWSDFKIREDISHRQAILSYMVREDITDYSNVVGVFYKYSRNPDYVMEKIRQDDLDPELLSKEV